MGLVSGTLPTGNRTFCFAKARFALLTGSSADNRQNLLQAEILPLFIVWSGSAYTRKKYPTPHLVWT